MLIEENKDPNNNEDGCFVYIIATTMGAYKIGVAKNPRDRYNCLKAGIPDPSEILLLIQCKGRKHAFAVERGIHNQLSEYRTAGEWFRPPKAVLAELILELGSRIDALTSEPPILKYIQIDSNPYEPVPDYSYKPHIDRSQGVINIISDLMRERNGAIEVDFISERAAEIGIPREKTEEILDRLCRDGEIFSPRPKKYLLTLDG